MTAIALIAALVACIVSFWFGMQAQVVLHPSDVSRVCLALRRRGIPPKVIECAMVEAIQEGVAERREQRKRQG